MNIFCPKCRRPNQYNKQDISDRKRRNEALAFKCVYCGHEGNLDLHNLPPQEDASQAAVRIVKEATEGN